MPTRREELMTGRPVDRQLGELWRVVETGRATLEDMKQQRFSPESIAATLAFTVNLITILEHMRDEGWPW